MTSVYGAADSLITRLVMDLLFIVDISTRCRVRRATQVRPVRE